MTLNITPMTSIMKMARGKAHLFHLPSSRIAPLFPIFMGLFGVLSGSDATQGERKIRGRNLRFLLQPLFLHYLLLRFYFSLLPLFLSIYLLASLHGGPYAIWFLTVPFLQPFIPFILASSGSKKSMKMMKKIRVSEEPSSASAFCFPVGEEARARFKYHSLLQDYQELLKETNDKSERLRKMLLKKSQLLAEVKFLRQKFQQFSTSSTAQLKLKKQAHRFPSPSVCMAQPKNPLFHTELPLKSRNHKVKETHIPTSTPLLDLNKVFLPTGEEMEGFDAEEQKLLNVGRLKRFSWEGGDVLSNDSMLLVCRDTRIGSNQASKRKVSWQDQQTLRV